jgi:hypothetical protein
MGKEKVGEVYFAPDCKFPDGEAANKLLIIVAVSPAEDYIALRTTSQSRLRSWEPGCQNGDSEPGFFIPQGMSFFRLDTWVCLDYEMLLDIYDFDRCVGKTIQLISNLDKSLLCEILRCASAAEFSGRSIKSIQNTIAEIGCS